MTKILRCALAALATAALAAPPAHANHTTARCVGVRVGVRAITGSTYEAVLAGVVVGGATEFVWVRCFVMVNGGDVSSVPTGSGIAVAASAGRATWSGSSGSLCVQWGDSHGTQTSCGQLWVG